jgi:hypothetical protein
MSNELKKLTLLRQLLVVRASSESGIVWTLSGLALASCIGGGGGGGPSSATDPLAASGFTSFARSTSGRFQASRHEVYEPISFNSALSTLTQLEAMGATYSHARRVGDSEAVYVFDVDNHDRNLEYTAVLGGVDGNKVKYRQVGDHVMVTGVASFDYDHPIDDGGNNTYLVTETATAINNPPLSLPNQLRNISETYTLMITDHPSDNNNNAAYAGNTGLYIYREFTTDRFVLDYDFTENFINDRVRYHEFTSKGELYNDRYNEFEDYSRATTPEGKYINPAIFFDRFDDYPYGILENTDGSTNPVDLGLLRSTLEGDYTLRLKATGTNDNSQFKLENGILYYIGSNSGDREDLQGPRLFTLEVEYVSGQTVFFTETYRMELGDVEVPVNATEARPDLFEVTTPETLEEIRITNVGTSLGIIQRLYDVGGIGREVTGIYRPDIGVNEGEQFSIGGPDAEKFFLSLGIGEPVEYLSNDGSFYLRGNYITIASKRGFDYEADPSALSAAGTNTYKFTLESNLYDPVMFEITITDLKGNDDPQLNDFI